MVKHRIYVGIDTGVNTGYAVYDNHRKEWLTIGTIKIHTAMFEVKKLVTVFGIENVKVFVEDARKARYGRNTEADKAKLKGAGSIGRDAQVWQDFLTDEGIEFVLLRPNKGITKLKADYFQKLTGITQRLSEHARDAVMLIFNR